MNKLKSHVEQRAQGASTEGEATRRPVRAGRRRWAPVGLTAGLAASVAAAVLVLNPGGGAGSAEAGRDAVESPAKSDNSLARISTVAYTLQKEPSGEVKVIMGKSEGEINVAGLRRDLARMGVRAKVMVSGPNCPAVIGEGETVSTSAPEPRQPVPADPGRKLKKAYRSGYEHGKYVVYVNPKGIPTDETLTFVFHDVKKVYGYSVSLWPGKGPECISAP